MGPAVVDPRSGEIVVVNIVISSSWMRASLKELELWGRQDGRFRCSNESHIIMDSPLSDDELLNKSQLLKGFLLSSSYDFSTESNERNCQLSEFPDGIKAFLRAGVKSVVMPEVGPTLGLRYNFR